MRKVINYFLITLILCSIHQISSQTIDPECTATSVNDIPVDFVDSGRESHVLYVIICNGWNCYYDDMFRGGRYLEMAVQDDWGNTGSTVRIVRLDGTYGFTDDQSNSLKKPLEWDKYTQVWVGDLASDIDNSDVHMDGYNQIVNWYQNRGKPHIICDGRFLSSYWNSGKAKNTWDMSNRPNTRLVRNYFANLRVRGGGLVLNTDHATSFTRGINEINKGVGINGFSNYFDNEPYLMEVDIESSIWNYPDRGYYLKNELERGQWSISDWWTDVDTVDYGFIVDDSSTSDAPFNSQPDGRVLYPVSWHQGYLNLRPGVSSTIQGKVGFLIGITTPSCDDHFVNSDTINFQAEILKGSTGTVTYVWYSNIDGIIQDSTTSQTLSKTASSLTPGQHIITCSATDGQGLVAEAKIRIRVIVLSGEPVCYSAGWNGGKNPQEIFPIKKGIDAVPFYSYGNPIADASNTNLEVPRVGQFYFYENTDNTVSLIANFGSGSVTSSSSKSYLTISVPVAAGNDDIGLQLIDSQFDTSKYLWVKSSGSGTFQFEFGSSTAGVILGPFPKKEFCATITLDKSKEDNIENFYVRSHTDPSADSINSNPVIHFSSAGVSTSDITLCYGQCKCPDSSLSELTESFNNHGINFLVSSGTLGHYTDVDNCEWRIQPSSPTGDDIWGISVYFNGALDIYEGDVLEVGSGDSSTGTVIDVYNGSSVANTVNTVSNEMYLKFKPTNDGNTGTGFSATYWVLPQLVSVSPLQVPTVESTTVVLSGANFIQSSSLKCKIETNTTTLTVPATYVDSKTVKCTVPPNPVLGFVNVEVSNDGIRYTITDGINADGAAPVRAAVQIEYINAQCSELTTCGACVNDFASSGCSWCNGGTANTSYCFSGSEQCSEPTETVETCCSSCYELNGCSGGGTCQCNNTCTCDSDRFSEPADCSCSLCPTHSNGEYCGGTIDNGRVIGICNCNGTCECGPGFWGPNCECVSCGGYNGLECGGVGECQCDGNCTCDENYVSLTETKQICECSEVCPTANNSLICSGHGSCNCGSCECDDGWELLSDCSCASHCENDCNGNGVCNCDGSCTCYDGYLGMSCDTKFDCNSNNCDNCTSLDSSCYWCSIDDTCVHKDDIKGSACTQDAVIQQGCPSLILEPAPEQPDTTPTIIAIIAGSAVALVLGGAIAFIVANTKASDPLLQFGTNPFGENAATVTSGVYQSETEMGTSAIYSGK